MLVQDTVLKEVINRSELEKRYVIYRNVLHDDSHIITCTFSIVTFKRKSLVLSQIKVIIF